MAGSAATHAWAEAYLPTLGWRGFDPTLGTETSLRHIVTGVSMAKWWTTELQKRLTSTCVQLHGGYGYMNEFPIARMFRDARVERIYGGTNEIMKVLIARTL